MLEDPVRPSIIESRCVAEELVLAVREGEGTVLSKLWKGPELAKAYMRVTGQLRTLNVEAISGCNRLSDLIDKFQKIKPKQILPIVRNSAVVALRRSGDNSFPSSQGATGKYSDKLVAYYLKVAAHERLQLYEAIDAILESGEISELFENEISCRHCVEIFNIAANRIAKGTLGSALLIRAGAIAATVSGVGLSDDVSWKTVLPEHDQSESIWEKQMRNSTQLKLVVNKNRGQINTTFELIEKRGEARGLLVSPFRSGNVPLGYVFHFTASTSPYSDQAVFAKLGDLKYRFGEKLQQLARSAVLCKEESFE